MASPPSRPPPPEVPPPNPTPPEVGRVNAFVGSRLVLLGLVLGGLGLALLVYSGVRLWLVIARGSLGLDAASVVVWGGLALALLSVGSSARRAGSRYLGGQRSVFGDVARLVARRVERRRRTRGG